MKFIAVIKAVLNNLLQSRTIMASICSPIMRHPDLLRPLLPLPESRLISAAGAGTPAIRVVPLKDQTYNLHIVTGMASLRFID